MNTQSLFCTLLSTAILSVCTTKAMGQTQLIAIIEDGVSKPFHYDPNGNMTKDDHNNQLVYGSDNELVKVIQSNGHVVYYQYDAKGQQIKQATSQNRAVYHYYTMGKLGSSVQHSELKYYVDSGELRLDLHQLTAKTQHYLTDNLGSIISNINSANKLTHHHRYLPFGLQSFSIDFSDTQTSLETVGKGYNGILTDSITGNQFLGNGYRVYNPRLQIFLQYDTFSPFDDGGIHGYAYADNNPIMAFDPSGHIPEWAKHVIVWGVGVTTATAIGMAIGASGGALAPAAKAHPIVMAAITGAIAGGSASVAAQATNTSLNKQNFSRQMRSGGYVGVILSTALGAAGGAVDGSSASAKTKVFYDVAMVFSEPAIEQGVMIGTGYQKKWDWENYAISALKNAASTSIGYNRGSLISYYTIPQPHNDRHSPPNAPSPSPDSSAYKKISHESSTTSQHPQFRRLHGDYANTIENPNVRERSGTLVKPPILVNNG